MNNKMLVGIVVLVVVVGGGYYFMKSSQSPSSALPQQEEQPTVATSPASTDMSGAQQIVVSGNEFAFSPSTITVKQGQPVSLTFKNTGKYPHNFVVADLGVESKKVKTGEEDTVTFTPTKAGSFTFICGVSGHADKGMTGTLTVE